MLPHEKRFRSVSVRAVRLSIIAAALATLLHEQALAHTVLLSRGTVAVHENRIVSRIETSAKDFIHYYHLRPTEEGFSVSTLRDAVLKHRQHLLEHFIIRNARGERLPGKCVDVEWNEPSDMRIGYSQLGEIRAVYVLECPTKTPPRYLTFQQFLGGEYAPMPVRLALSVTTGDDATSRFIQLTNRGNVETLEFAGSEPAAQRLMSASVSGDQPGHPSHALRRDRFKTVYARMHIEGKTVRCDIYMPLVLLETWLPLQRASRDFIDAKEMAAARERLRAFFAGHNPIRLNDRLAAPSAVRLDYLGPDALSIDEPQVERLGAWSARVGVRLSYENNAPVSRVEWIWDLFNNAVLNATVTTAFGDSRSEKVVTLYSPSVSWSRRGLSIEAPISVKGD
jgi:hypothetical protein